jgi:hypothetical protein
VSSLHQASIGLALLLEFFVLVEIFFELVLLFFEIIFKTLDLTFMLWARLARRLVMISGVYTVLIVVMLLITLFMVEEFVKRIGMVRFCSRLFLTMNLIPGPLTTLHKSYLST